MSLDNVKHRSYVIVSRLGNFISSCKSFYCSYYSRNRPDGPLDHNYLKAYLLQDFFSIAPEKNTSTLPHRKFHKTAMAVVPSHNQHRKFETAYNECLGRFKQFMARKHCGRKACANTLDTARKRTMDLPILKVYLHMGSNQLGKASENLLRQHWKMPTGYCVSKFSSRHFVDFRKRTRVSETHALRGL